jgi:hypothetical protein
MPDAHHHYSPSALKHYATCPGFVKEDKENEQAAEGTKLHKCVEVNDLSGLNDEQVALAKYCLDYLAIFERGADSIYKELWLDLGITSGTADRVIIKGRHAELLDWKFGRNPVEDAETNIQGWAYACGVFERFNVDSVRVHFVLPRQDVIDVAIFSRAQYSSMKRAVVRIIGHCEEYQKSHDSKMLNLTTTTCEWCAMNGKCTATRTLALTYVAKYERLELVNTVHSSEITDPAEAANYLKQIRVLEKMVEGAKKHLIEFAKLNGGLPGYKFVERSGGKYIDKPYEAYQQFKEI